MNASFEREKTKTRSVSLKEIRTPRVVAFSTAEISVHPVIGRSIRKKMQHRKSILVGSSENCCLRYETRGENSSFSWATAVIHVDDDITNLHPLWNEQLKGWPSRLSVTPLEKNVVLPIGHANVLASRPRIHRDPRLDQLV